MVAADQRLLTVGRPLEVTYHRPGGGGDYRVQLVPAGKASRWSVADLPAQAVGWHGHVPDQARSTSSREPMSVVLTEGVDPGTVLARTPVWLKAKGAKPSARRPTSTSYVEGEPIVVSWENAPANRWDWLGVYKASAADPMVDYYLIWQYTGGAASGTMAGPPAGRLALDGTRVGRALAPAGRQVQGLLPAGRRLRGGRRGELHGDEVKAG